MGHWRHLLDAMVADGAEHQAVDRLPLLDDAERHQVLAQWNATAADYPRDACVHELFEAQVARTPSAIAVVQGEVSLTYGELNARANRLAHYLRELFGCVCARMIVWPSVCRQRSVEMVVALLAVLKAGGAYVPLDPAYPPERLAYMQSDCGALVMLTDTVSRHLVEHPTASTVVVRSVEMVVALLAVLKAGGAYVPLDPAYPPERLAYMQSDCGALVMLTDTVSRHLVEHPTASTVVVDRFASRWRTLAAPAGQQSRPPDRHPC